MTLIATSAGWEENPDTGDREYVIRLLAESREDAPNLRASDIWDRTPLRLERTEPGPQRSEDPEQRP